MLSLVSWTKDMNIEIERKFLVRSGDWRSGVVRKVELTDGLLSLSEGQKIRVRRIDDGATITIKGPRTGLAREEFEYPIPLADAQHLLSHYCTGGILEKTRHFVPFGGLEWEVDVYHGLLDGVVIAEIELPAADTPFDLPHWVGEEVTGQECYRKINMLAERPPVFGRHPSEAAAGRG